MRWVRVAKAIGYSFMACGLAAILGLGLPHFSFWLHDQLGFAGAFIILMIPLFLWGIWFFL